MDLYKFLPNVIKLKDLEGGQVLKDVFYALESVSQDLDDKIRNLLTLLSPFEATEDELNFLCDVIGYIALGSKIDDKTRRALVSQLIRFCQKKGTKDGIIKYAYYSGLHTLPETALPVTELYKAKLEEDRRYDFRSGFTSFPSARVWYSCTTLCESGCETVCETSCESDCETVCETSCESGCESGCESICQTLIELNYKYKVVKEIFDKVAYFYPIHVRPPAIGLKETAIDTFGVPYDDDFTIEIVCQTTCEMECQASCETFCQETCEIVCESSCEGACEQECQTQCQIVCENVCQAACEIVYQSFEPCSTSCELACQEGCEGTCQFACQIICQTGCETYCQEGCEISCQSICQITCEFPCETGCQTTCEVNCEYTDELFCIFRCEIVCQTACEGTCETVCETSCQYAYELYCLFRCELSCQTCCEVTCQYSCETACQDGCQLHCQTGCEVTCQYAYELFCLFTCEMSCQSCCEDICQAGEQGVPICQISCQYGCQSLCEWSCEESCQTTCEVSCEIGACEQVCEQSGCQVVCQAACQANCQLGCETFCESSCENIGEMFEKECWIGRIDSDPTSVLVIRFPGREKEDLSRYWQVGDIVCVTRYNDINTRDYIVARIEGKIASAGKGYIDVEPITIWKENVYKLFRKDDEVEVCRGGCGGSYYIDWSGAYRCEISCETLCETSCESAACQTLYDFNPSKLNWIINDTEFPYDQGGYKVPYCEVIKDGRIETNRFEIPRKWAFSVRKDNGAYVFDIGSGRLHRRNKTFIFSGATGLELSYPINYIYLYLANTDLPWNKYLDPTYLDVTVLNISPEELVNGSLGDDLIPEAQRWFCLGKVVLNNDGTAYYIQYITEDIYDFVDIPDGAYFRYSGYANSENVSRTLDWYTYADGVKSTILELYNAHDQDKCPPNQYRIPFLPKDTNGTGSLDWLTVDGDAKNRSGTSWDHKSIQKYVASIGGYPVSVLELFNFHSLTDPGTQKYRVPFANYANSSWLIDYAHIVTYQDNPYIDNTYYKELLVGVDYTVGGNEVDIGVLYFPEQRYVVSNGRLNFVDIGSVSVHLYGSIIWGNIDPAPLNRRLYHCLLNFEDIEDHREEAKTNYDHDYRYACLGVDYLVGTYQGAYFKSIGGGSDTLPDPDGVKKLIDLYNGTTYPCALLDTDGRNSVKWNDRELIDTSNRISLDWEFRVLLDSSKVLSLDWEARLLTDYAGEISVNWRDRELINPGSKVSVDWEFMLLRDFSEIISVDWGNRSLKDSYQKLSLKWQDRLLLDTSEKTSVKWNDRQLIDTSGNYTTVDWENLRLKGKGSDTDLWEVNTNFSVYQGSGHPLSALWVGYDGAEDGISLTGYDYVLIQSSDDLEIVSTSNATIQTYADFYLNTSGAVHLSGSALYINGHLGASHPNDFILIDVYGQQKRVKLLGGFLVEP